MTVAGSNPVWNYLHFTVVMTGGGVELRLLTHNFLNSRISRVYILKLDSLCDQFKQEIV